MFENVSFIKSVFNLEDVPHRALPEVILCGRSNVGKSSFINSLFNKKSLAKTSSSPGKTRSINFYDIDETFYLVDLPGFGYAKISKSEREKWGKLVSGYILDGKNIALAMHFVDSRHKPTQLDVMLNEMLKTTGIPYFFILTKTDKLKQSEFSQSAKNLSGIFSEAKINENIVLYSSMKGRGQKDIKKILGNMFY
ncbi:MAG: ribosome biogenesis GTP-binding protein YihA/YsxC [Ignavibacteria bacterium]|nr:ribosome biogenesis GTP-binding protein YihA/YsxC [Ignavibacteria bacterium]